MAHSQPEPESTSRGYWVLGLIVIGVVVVDQLTKLLVRTRMVENQSIPLLGKWLAITYIQNPGGAFGMLAGHTAVFLLTGVVVIAGLLYNWKRIAGLDRWNALAFALILGGAFGNLTDRLHYHSVVDFVEVFLPGPWGPGMRWVRSFPCFNVADSAITVGITMILLWSIFVGERKEPPAQREAQPEREEELSGVEQSPAPVVLDHCGQESISS